MTSIFDINWTPISADLSDWINLPAIRPDRNTSVIIGGFRVMLNITYRNSSPFYSLAVAGYGGTQYFQDYVPEFLIQRAKDFYIETYSQSGSPVKKTITEKSIAKKARHRGNKPRKVATLLEMDYRIAINNDRFDSIMKGIDLVFTATLN
jgi:hypothetical protein